MKKTIKPLAIFSAAALLACTTGCADTSWSFKTDDTTISNGMYIYYTYIAYNEAQTEVTEETESSEEAAEESSIDVLAQEIEGNSAEQWIKDKATEECVAQMTMDKLIKENKITVDEEELKIYEDYALQWYQYSSAFYTELGISKESYITATGTYSGLSEQLFLSMYDTDGTKEVSKEDKEKYFTENYTDYFYIPYSLKTTDDSGNSVDIDDETLDKVKTNFAKYADMLNTKGKTTSDVVTQYKVDFETETDPSTSATTVIDNTDESELLKAISELDEKKATIKTINNTYYLIYKGTVADKVSTIEEDESVNTSLLHRMKDEEYKQYLDDEEAKLKYETNDACLSKYTVQRIIDILKAYSAE